MTADRVARRGFLGALASFVAGCAAPPAEAPPPPGDVVSPLRVPQLRAVLPLAHLRWTILTEPRAVASIPWLIPAINRVAPEENLARFTRAVGFDLRQVPEAIIADYGGGDEPPSTIYVVRHNADPLTIERLFRARLVGEEHRAVDRADVVRVSGALGTKLVTLLLAGRDVAAFQVGGSASRGPARVASLYARELLKRSPTLLAEDPLKALEIRLGEAPFRAFAPGPFDGELARGARGLLAAATGVGCAVRPSVREGLLVSIAVSGDFSKSGPGASEELARAWSELAHGTFGHLMGLDEPVEKPLSTHADDAVAVAIEIDPNKLAKGLVSATTAGLEEIMR